MSKQVTLSNGVAVQKNRKPMASILLFMLNFGARYDSPVFFIKLTLAITSCNCFFLVLFSGLCVWTLL